MGCSNKPIEVVFALVGFIDCDVVESPVDKFQSVGGKELGERCSSNVPNAAAISCDI